MTQAVLADILAAEKAWVQAHLEGDVPALDALMHPEYTIIWPGGRVVSKEEALASYNFGKRQWDGIASDELDIRLYGEFAVVDGLWRAKGVNHETPFDYRARFTSVWIRQQGSWRLLVDRSMELK